MADGLANRTLQVFLGILLAALIVSMGSQFSELYRYVTPVAKIYEVHELIVTDARVGEDPTILIVRSVHDDFLARWSAEIQTLEGVTQTGCFGRGENTYASTLPDRLEKPLFAWMIDRPDCNLKPGQYVIEATWRVTKPGWPEKQVTAVSNVFTISE